MRPVRPASMFIPYSRAENRKSVSRKMDPRQWALSFVGCIVALTEYKDSVRGSWYYLYGAAVVLDWAGNGKYIKVASVDKAGNVSKHWAWANASRYYRAYDTLQILQLERQLSELQAQIDSTKAEAEAVAKQQLSVLSQNTVTRALVHAYDNDYCHETAVALISAGHKMPDVTLSFEVTLAVSVTLEGNDSYYPLRNLFGSTRGEVQGARGLSLGDHEVVNDAIREAIAEASTYGMQVEHTDTEVDWKAPILRMTDQYEAAREITRY